jgi:putative thymidine phosphorylase
VKLVAKNLPIATGDVVVAVLCERDATRLDLHPSDRIQLEYGRKKIVATVDVMQHFNGVHGKYQKHVLRCGQVGLFAEAQEKLGVLSGAQVTIKMAKKPVSIQYILKKLRGERLSREEIHAIITDIAHDSLSAIEMTYFVAGSYLHELSMREVKDLTDAMVSSGDVLRLKSRIVVDKHCIGGVAANRTSPIVVSILAAAGLTVPKTSSRSITSAAGTADTLEVLFPVTLSLSQMKNVIKKTGACLVWGGSMSLAPADDKIIRVEYPVSLDPTGQLLASIMAKKKSVSATHVLIDIPVGKGAKITNKKHALELKNKFEALGKMLKMKVEAVLTDGSQPIGNGIGPSLEARDVLWTLKGSSEGSLLLRNKSLIMAASLLELTGKAKKGKGLFIAEELLDSGKAYEKFVQIMKAQGGKEINPSQIRLARKKHHVLASKSGKIVHIDNKVMNKIARIAGAPHDQEAGVYLYYHKGSRVKRGERLFTVYSDSKERLQYALDVCKKMRGIEIT